MKALINVTLVVYNFHLVVVSEVRTVKRVYNFLTSKVEIKPINWLFLSRFILRPVAHGFVTARNFLVQTRVSFLKVDTVLIKDIFYISNENFVRIVNFFVKGIF